MTGGTTLDVYIYQVSYASDVPLEAVFLGVEQAAFLAVRLSMLEFKLLETANSKTKQIVVYVLM